jgi:HK97 family phage major capsid protein
MALDPKALHTRNTEILNEQERILNSASEAKRQLAADEEITFANLTKELDANNITIARFAAINKGREVIATPREHAIITSSTSSTATKYSNCTAAYGNAFWNAMKTRSFTNAVLGEGGAAADGGFLFPTVTDPGIRTLATIEAAARKLSLVVPTEVDTKYPYQASKAFAMGKAETNSTASNAFANNVPTFGSTTLSAFNAGDYITISWELMQDVPQLTAFLTKELTRAVFEYEESTFINGSGTGQPLGYLNGATPSSTAALNIDSILDLESSLKSAYYPGASFLFNRGEFNRLRKAQLAIDQFQSYITNEGSNFFLDGFPVAFSTAMPSYLASPESNGAVLFGSFAQGWIIGDRGGSDVRVKVLDQIGALNGTTTVLGYRRTDQRCLIQEAVQMLTTNG